MDIDIINNCVQLKVKLLNQNYTMYLMNCYISKISHQERVILGVLDYLEK